MLSTFLTSLGYPQKDTLPGVSLDKIICWLCFDISRNGQDASERYFSKVNRKDLEVGRNVSSGETSSHLAFVQAIFLSGWAKQSPNSVLTSNKWSVTQGVSLRMHRLSTTHDAAVVRHGDAVLSSGSASERRNDWNTQGTSRWINKILLQLAGGFPLWFSSIPTCFEADVVHPRYAFFFPVFQETKPKRAQRVHLLRRYHTNP